MVCTHHHSTHKGARTAELRYGRNQASGHTATARGGPFGEAFGIDATTTVFTAHTAAEPAGAQRPTSVAAGGVSAYWAACTNLSVKVLLKSIDLPFTSGLNACSTFRSVLGPLGGMSPVGL